VPEVKNFDHFLLFIHSVVDKNRRVEEASHRGEASYGTANEWESLEQFDVIKQRIPKFFTVGRVMIPSPVHEAFEIS
jgi:hypothetical protein